MGKTLLLLLLAGCSFENRHHYYSTSFDSSDGKRMLAWAADVNGRRFRYVVDDGEGRLDKKQVQTWPRKLDSYASVTVVLPETANEQLRKRTDKLLADARKANGNVGAHVVYDDDRWRGFKKSREVTERLAQLKSEATERRPPEQNLFNDLFDGLAMAMVASLTPDAVVLPSDNGFLIATGFYTQSFSVAKPEDVKIEEVQQDDIVKLMKQPKTSDEEQLDELGKAFGDKFAKGRAVVVIHPAGTPDARCLVLVEALGRLENARAVYYSVKESYDELKTPDKLRAYMAKD